MARCSGCGNDYSGTFQVTMDGRSYDFDSFECAIRKLAPICGSCGCGIIGHGVESDDRMFCSAHCARVGGVQGLTDHVGAHLLHRAR